MDQVFIPTKLNGRRAAAAAAAAAADSLVFVMRSPDERKKTIGAERVSQAAPVLLNKWSSINNIPTVGTKLKADGTERSSCRVP